MADKIIVFSTIPGRHRGGMTHPRAAEYPMGSIGRGALEQIAADPVLAIGAGELVTTATLAALLDANDAAARPAKGKKES